jgi:hypothetical protein
MLKADPDITSEPCLLPPRPPTPQERADELLMRWRLGRSLGLPPSSGSIRRASSEPDGSPD